MFRSAEVSVNFAGHPLAAPEVTVTTVPNTDLCNIWQQQVFLFFDAVLRCSGVALVRLVYQKSGGIFHSETLFITFTLWFYLSVFKNDLLWSKTARCSHPSSSPQGPLNLPLALWNLTRVLVLVSEKTAIGLKLSHKSVVTQADERRFENVW